ncbi:MAG TPA: twin-arginine translocation signal domain-containing protein, partial [Planctomycetaceae bacterium]
MNSRDQRVCPDCDTTVDRRSFIKTVGATALAAAAPVMLGGRIVQAAPSAQSTAETAVGRFYQSLSDQQKQAIAFPFDHDLRKKINANWQVTKPKLEDDF